MNLSKAIFKALRSGFTYFVIFTLFLVFTAKNFKQAKWESLHGDSVNLEDSIVAFAKQLQGIHYQRGGLDESGFDCSGFTYFVYKNYNIRLPRSSRAQFGSGIKLTPEEIKKADLVFFKGRNIDSREIGHVGIVVEGCEAHNLAFIHASSSQGIRIDSLNHPYYQPRFIGASRVINRN